MISVLYDSCNVIIILPEDVTEWSIWVARNWVNIHASFNLLFIKRIIQHYTYSVSRHSSVCVVSGYGLSRLDPRHRRKIFPLASVQTSSGLTQPCIQWVPGVLFPGLKSGRGVTLTNHPHLVPRLRMSRSYTSSPPSAFVACSGTAFALTIHIIWYVYFATK
jgi:hypothetical protein